MFHSRDGALVTCLLTGPSWVSNAGVFVTPVLRVIRELKQTRRRRKRERHLKM